jgi:hypothetical protein
MIAFIEHLAGTPDIVARTQACSRCGLVLASEEGWIHWRPSTPFWAGQSVYTDGVIYATKPTNDPKRCDELKVALQ